MQVAESLGDCGDVRWVKQLAQHSDHDAEHGECRTLEQHEQSNATLCKRPSSNSDERPTPPSRPRGKPRVIATEQLCGIARATAVDKLTPMACSYSPHIGTSGVDDGGKNTLQLRYALIGEVYLSRDRLSVSPVEEARDDRKMERTEQRNVDDPNVSWEDLALSEIDGQANFYKVASVGEVQARHLLEALAEDRRTARSPDSRQYRSVLSLVNVPGWGDRTVLNMIAANWVFQPYTSDGEAPAIDPKVPEPKQTLMVQYDQAKENSFAWFIHE